MSENQLPANKSLEEKYQSMDEIEHILSRPGMYIGSIYGETMPYSLFVPSENRIKSIDNIPYTAGLLKLFDEVFTNSIDERRRSSRMFDINNIDVEVRQDGTVIIQDDGGIPIQYHKVEKMYLPKLLFGKLRTSSNYTEIREGAGINGIGAKIANIFSYYFKCTTSDGKKLMDIQWSDNMRKVDYENITDVTDGKHFTRFEFKIELNRFEREILDLSTIRIIQKRIIDACACNVGLTVNFTTDIADGKLNGPWNFATFKDYVKLYLKPEWYDYLQEWTNPIKNDCVYLLPYFDGLQDIGFVNGTPCNTGNHFMRVWKQLIDYSLPILHKNEMELLTDRDILARMVSFVNVSVHNPDYASQSKEKLTSKIPIDTLKLPKTFLANFHESEIILSVADYYKTKYEAEKKKQLRKLNQAIKGTKTKKLIECSNNSNTNLAELWVFEGESAKNGFNSHRNTQNQAAYILRGKVKNTLELSKEDIVKNDELREIIAALGLQFNEPVQNIKNCKYKKIIFATDMDYDGDHICGLLITFFAKNFPELFIQGYIYRAMSPLVIAKNKSNSKETLFWDLDNWESTKDNYAKGYSIKYCKGLGSLSDHHYDEMLNNQRLIQFKITKTYMDTINVWFSKNVEIRKSILSTDNITEDSLVS